jgi:hypothetical protein
VRRRAEPAPGVPEHLARFCPEDWAIEVREAYSLWFAARCEWSRAQPELNVVDFICAGREERLSVMFPHRQREPTSRRWSADG